VRVEEVVGRGVKGVVARGSEKEREQKHLGTQKRM